MGISTQYKFESFGSCIQMESLWPLRNFLWERTGTSHRYYSFRICTSATPSMRPHGFPSPAPFLNLINVSFGYEQNLKGENTKLSGLFGHCSKQVTQKSTGTCLVHKKLMITKCGDTNRCGDNLRRTRCKIGSPNLLAKHRPKRDHVRS